MITELSLWSTQQNTKLAISGSKGDIQVWESDKPYDASKSWNLTEIDKFNLFENPFGLEVSKGDLQVYKDKQRHLTKAQLLSTGQCICCCDSLQYMYIRDTQKHEVNNVK